MKDFRGVELKVGDTIAYATRWGSCLQLKETKIVEFKYRKTYREEEQTIAVCENPNYVSVEEQAEDFHQRKLAEEERIAQAPSELKDKVNRYYTKYPFSPTYYRKTIQLVHPSYIVKVG